MYEQAIRLAPTEVAYYRAKCAVLYYLGRNQEVGLILAHVQQLEA